jgi:hypothetical protein
MRRTLLLAAAIVALPLSASAAPASAAECKAHLAASLAAMSADRFAEELAGAEGVAGNATPAIRSAAVLLTDLNGIIADRAAELDALKAQLANVQSIQARLATLREKEPTSSHYLDPNAEASLNTLRDSLTARVTRLGTQLAAERTALDQDLQFHCTASAPSASAAAH